MVEKPALAYAKIGGMAWRDPPYFDIPNLRDSNALCPWGIIRNSGDSTSAFWTSKSILVIKMIEVEAVVVASDLAT
jgi:hypothetical protein